MTRPRVDILSTLDTKGVAMKPKKKETHKRTSALNQGGRPARPMPELIPDTPENIARASMMGPPKKQKQWRYLRESG